MKNIKEINLILENCEVINFDVKHVGYFHIGKISEEINRIATNAISKYNIANSIHIEIFKEANDIPYNPFGIGGKNSSRFKRLTDYSDITQIELIDEENNSYIYFADYNEEVEGQLGANNLNQKTYISELGNLYIVIEEGKEVFDYFDKDEINNSEYIEFHKEMIME